MPSVIAAGTTSGTSLNLSGDTSGVLQLQTNGVTPAVTIDTSQNVGIGTASPAAKLDVASEIRVTSGSNIGRLLTDGSNFYVGTRSNIPMRFETNSTTQMFIDTSGNVGIGTSSPNALLTIAAASTDTRIRLVGRSADGTSAIRYYSSDNATQYGFLSFGNAYAEFNYVGSGYMGFATNNTERMRIDSSGNVGIGTSSPSSALHVSRSSGESVVQITNAGSGASWVHFSPTSGAAYLHNTANTPLIFTTNGTERMRITSGGDLVIGGTTATYKLTINAGASTGAIKLLGDASFIEFNNSGTSIAGGGNLTLKGAGAIDAISGGSGGVSLGSGATSWTSISDEKQKDIIEPIIDAINKVSTLRAVIGKYKTDKEGTRRSFLIAQDVQKVLPEAIDVKDDEEKTLGLRYTEVIPLLVAAIKEQQAMIEELKQEVAKLKGV